MKLGMFVLVGAGLLASPMCYAQTTPAADQTPRFEETLDVRPTAPPNITVTGARTDYFMTFSEPVSVPGVTLKPDTYLFRFPEGPGTDVIQVMKADRSDALAMFDTIPVTNASRDMTSDAEVVLARRGPRGAPLAMTALYLPGRETGFELLYPR